MIIFSQLWDEPWNITEIVLAPIAASCFFAFGHSKPRIPLLLLFEGYRENSALRCSIPPSMDIELEIR